MNRRITSYRFLTLVMCMLMLLFWVTAYAFGKQEDEGTYLNVYYHPDYEKGQYVYGPCGVHRAMVEARDSRRNIVLTKVCAKSVPRGMEVKFTDTLIGPRALRSCVWNLGNEVTTCMHIRTYDVDSGDYTIKVRAKFYNLWGQQWKKDYCYNVEVHNVDPESLPEWSDNPYLHPPDNKWDVRAFWWSILGGSGEYEDPPPGETYAVWEGDESILLHARDTQADLCCDCAAATLRVDDGGLQQIRAGDIKAAFILLKRQDWDTDPAWDGAAGNIINLWLHHPEHTGKWRFGFDTYFETEGINGTFSERRWDPSAHQVVYSAQMKYNNPVTWMRNHYTYADGSDYWVINLKNILDRSMEYLPMDLREHKFEYIEPISESFSLFGQWSSGKAWQRIKFFKVTGLTW